jgi:apolipoprotein N-acyltransferase
MPDRLLRGWRGIAIFAILGAIAALGQAPVDWPIATVLSLAAAIALYGQAGSVKGAGKAGWAYGFGYFLLALAWIVNPFLVEPQRDGWMAPFALVLLPAGLGLFWAAAFALAKRIGGGAFALAGSLALAEALRSFALTGFPWALLGHVWTEAPHAQLAAWVGPHGLTLLTALLAAMLARALAGGRARIWAGLGALVLGLLPLSLKEDPPAQTEAGPVIRLVQPNVPQADKWNADLIDVFQTRLLDLTASGDRPDLIIWPETAIPYLLEYSGSLLDAAIAAADGVPMVIGVNRQEGGLYYNSLIVLDADGDISDIYDKQHLVPFGEYVPFGELMGKLGIQGLAASQGGGFSAGQGIRRITLPGIGEVEPLICYEAIFAEEIAQGARARALIQITNDAWFGNLQGPQQHFAQSRLRAIEQGLPLVRVANTGISAVVDAKGRVLSQLPLGEAGKIDVVLPMAGRPTVYSKLGDWPAIVAAIALAFAAFMLSQRRSD